MNNFPFKQTKSGNVLLREFSADIDSKELVWHRDREDRVITVAESKGMAITN